LGVWFAKARNVAIFLLVLSGLLTIHGTTATNTPPESLSVHGTPTSVSFEPAINAAIIILPLLILIVVLFVFTIINGISAYAAAEASHGRMVGLKMAWRATLDRFGAFFWLQVLTGLKILLWSLLFIVPGIIMAVRYSLANIAFFDKKLSANAALRESVALTHRSWITTFAAQMFLNVITLGVIEPLVTIGAKTTLYRQLMTYRKEDKPAPHVLSKVTLAVSIALAIILGTLLIFLSHSLFNYALNTTI
jgi:hypothetical protein